MHTPKLHLLTLGFMGTVLLHPASSSAHWPFNTRPVAVVGAPLALAPTTPPVLIQQAPVLLTPTTLTPAPLASSRFHPWRHAAPVYAAPYTIQPAPQYILQLQPVTTSAQAPADQVPETIVVSAQPTYTVYAYQFVPVALRPQAQVPTPTAQTIAPISPVPQPAQSNVATPTSSRLVGTQRDDLIASLRKFTMEAGSAIPEAQRLAYLRDHAVLLYAGKLGISPGNLNESERQDIEQIVSAITGSNAASPPPAPNTPNATPAS